MVCLPFEERRGCCIGCIQWGDLQSFNEYVKPHEGAVWDSQATRIHGLTEHNPKIIGADGMDLIWPRFLQCFAYYLKRKGCCCIGGIQWGDLRSQVAVEAHSIPTLSLLPPSRNGILHGSFEGDSTFHWVSITSHQIEVG